MILFSSTLFSQRIVYTIDYQTKRVFNTNTQTFRESDRVKKEIFISYNACLDTMYFADDNGIKSFPIIPETIVKDSAGIRLDFRVSTQKGFMYVAIWDKFNDWFNNTNIDHVRNTSWSDIWLIETDNSGTPKMVSSEFVINIYHISGITMPHYN